MLADASKLLSPFDQATANIQPHTADLVCSVTFCNTDVVNCLHGRGGKTNSWFFCHPVQELSCHDDGHLGSGGTQQQVQQHSSPRRFQTIKPCNGAAFLCWPHGFEAMFDLCLSWKMWSCDCPVTAPEHAFFFPLAPSGSHSTHVFHSTQASPECRPRGLAQLQPLLLAGPCLLRPLIARCKQQHCLISVCYPD